MKEYPGGTWITLEGHAEKEIRDLVAIGYKYNKKTMIVFVYTKGAGSTKAGDPYNAKFLIDLETSMYVRCSGHMSFLTTSISETLWTYTIKIFSSILG
mmetsp:Transcript_20926/g.20131  ORF Transcript_20926/g.20131 Transcript_20926/m.20131 type:complete len:98 (-) Transcript_20926:507-800(-)